MSGETTPTTDPQAALNALSAEDRASWELTGEWPTPGKVTTTAEPTPEPDDEPAEPETPPAPETPAPAATPAAVAATPDKSHTPPKPGSRRSQRDQEFINERIRESVREATARLQAEIADLRAKSTQAETKTEPVAAPIVDPKDPEPQVEKFEDVTDYWRALMRWEVRQEKRESDAASAKAEQAKRVKADEDAFHERALTWIDRRDAFLAKHPERVDRVTTFLDTVTPGTPIGDAIMESEVGGELSDYLASNPKEAERIARLPPISALRALGRLESLFSPVTSTSASAGPAAKLVTTAPAPPTTFAARSADPADASVASVARGDFLAFEAEENRRAVAAHR